MTTAFLILLFVVFILIAALIGEEKKIKDLELEADSYKAVARKLEEILHEEREKYNIR